MAPLELTRRGFLARTATALAGASLVAPHRARPAIAGRQPTAMAFSWGDAAIADLPRPAAFRHDHTLALRFLPQYVSAYTAPLVSGQGLLVALGDFFRTEPSGSTKLVVRVGSRRKVYPVRLEAGSWYHLALVRNGDDLSLFLDGRQLRPPVAIGKARPQGPLVLGRAATEGAQFYGLIDDVALAGRPLSAARIRTLARRPFLRGDEPDLAPVAMRSSPALVAVSATRDGSADRAAVPFGPGDPLAIPFPPGEAWEVIEGFDDPFGSHRGYAAFGWDLVLAGRPRSETSGRPFLAAAPGTAERVVDEHGAGPPRWNSVSVRRSPGQVCDYLHLARGSARVVASDQVAAGQALGAVGDTGVAAGAYHLHLAVTTLGEAARDKPGYVTIPASFGSYEASDDAGRTWRAVPRGVPATGQWVRRPAGS